MERKSLLDRAIYQETIERIGRLTIENRPIWGKMDVAQMMAHCSEVQDVYAGRKKLSVPWYSHLMKKMIAKTVYGDTPYKQNTPTTAQFKVVHPIDYDEALSSLLESLAYLYQRYENDANSFNHPLFGSMTQDQLGWAMYKHMDHHLRQFGV